MQKLYVIYTILTGYHHVCTPDTEVGRHDGDRLEDDRWLEMRDRY